MHASARCSSRRLRRRCQDAHCCASRRQRPERVSVKLLRARVDWCAVCGSRTAAGTRRRRCTRLLFTVPFLSSRPSSKPRSTSTQKQSQSRAAARVSLCELIDTRVQWPPHCAAGREAQRLPARGAVPQAERSARVNQLPKLLNCTSLLLPQNDIMCTCKYFTTMGSGHQDNVPPPQPALATPPDEPAAATCASYSSLTWRALRVARSSSSTHALHSRWLDM